MERRYGQRFNCARELLASDETAAPDGKTAREAITFLITL
jgi:hypothetical protein